MKTGVILARLQPIHNGHLALIEKAVNENDEVYVFIGSADKFNQRNPLPISLRMQLAQEAINDRFGTPNTHYGLDNEYSVTYDKDKIHIIPLDDLTDESDNSHDWGFYLYSKIVTECKNPCFTIYYSDGFEIITTWFPSFILRNNINLCLLARNATVSGISATKVRQMIEEDNKDLDVYVPKCVVDNRETIKKHIELSKLIK
jgi:cytidyltransferase-like protein